MSSTTILGGIWKFVVVTDLLAKQLASVFVKDGEGDALLDY